ncbi:hypothetical protein V9L05_06425 [Bernardetia sp. Wsw4-3y2]|uniref:hypothetical protein n=1 Tax=Bernardetia sp. Wsw4-3y2 TaxID=3127471 RepID=UPI0030D2FBBD
MKNIFVLIVFFFVCVSSCFACLETNQLKLFPIGIYNNSVISIDIQIQRRDRLGTEEEEMNEDFEPVSWIIQTRLSVYDLHQNLISSKLIDSTNAIGRSYLKELSKSHDKTVKLILEKYSTIELFEVKYLSFCDFQEECNNLTTQYDENTQTKKLTYENKEFDLAVFKDKTNYFLKDGYLENSVVSLSISSIRVYETKKVKLVIAHLGTGEYLPVLANLPRKEYKNEEIDYSSIKRFVYQEPVNHHGKGLDVFFSIVK